MVLITYDQSSAESFASARQIFERIDKLYPAMPVVFVATKGDLKPAPFVRSVPPYA